MNNQVVINGVLHKIGARGFVFWLLDGEWKRSTKTRRDVEREIRAQRTSK